MLISIGEVIILHENQQSNIYFCSIKHQFRDHQNYKKQSQLARAKPNT